MNIDMGKRLKSERLRRGIAVADFAALCGVSRTTQFNYEAGDRAPDADYLAKAHEHGIDVSFVLTGTKPATSQDSDFVVIKSHDVNASAGPGVVNGDHHEVNGLAFSRKWLASKGLSERTLEVINVAGDSMSPRLNDGDKVLVDTSDTQPRSGRVYVLRQGDELLVKFCQLMPEGVLRVTSANQNYAAYDIDLAKSADSVSILGRVRASTHEW